MLGGWVISTKTYQNGVGKLQAQKSISSFAAEDANNALRVQIIVYSVEKAMAKLLLRLVARTNLKKQWPEQKADAK